ncbi:uncharacterized protein TNCV_2068711 [Trichonephila clavipes]|uniref:Histone-lysine N-methyltransferase SETMAR n=1 Tax=Trichonephila clavipes TaxID=2585209 RepID=A0A8X6W395_TRICX|nr:uncharacterized protein TNCV_2068711 [Trichonephila clavipes]
MLIVLFDINGINMIKWAPLSQTFLADKRVTVLEHPPYSPDLATCDFYLLLKVKNALMGTHFQSVEVKVKTAHLLKTVTANESELCFELWKTRIQPWIDREGKHVEGD